MSDKAPDPLKTTLNLDAAQALFEGQIQGLVVTLYQNERPPAGLAGILDWYFQGALSHYLRTGAVTGKPGECTYFPFSKHGTTHHIILTGAGQSPFSGKRTGVHPETLQALHKNLISLKLSKIGISKSDFGEVNSDFFTKHLKGVPLWITH